MNIYLDSKKINITVKKLNFLGRFSGLMFKSEKIRNLLFDFYYPRKWAIHSYFVFFDFLAVWLDEKNRVMETRIVKPWTFSVKPEKKFKKLIEIPCNSRNTKIIGFLVGKKKHLNRELIN